MGDADARGDAGERLRVRGPRRPPRGISRGRWRRAVAGLIWLAAVAALTLPQGAAAAKTGPNPITFSDASGAIGTYSTTGPVDLQGPFFQLLGTNGRSCSTCHSPQAGWSITPADVQGRFAATGGTEPIFRLVDGANSPRADVSTVAARRAAYSLLLSRAVIRVGLPVPAGAEFELAAVDDPYGYAGAAELSLFRRPLPSANLRFLSAVMWDGRETVPGQPISSNFTTQASNATLGHAEAKVAPTAAQLQQIVAFQNALFTAQASDAAAGALGAAGGGGGPVPLASQPFYIGINDPLAPDPTGQPSSMVAFTLYRQWGDARHTAAQQAVARGEALFNTFAFDIAAVGGLNDVLGQPTLRGTCSTCHNAPNAGNHSMARPLNIGVADAARRAPDVPLYTLRHKTTGQTVQTTDPGRALITGKWADVGKFKGPVLRGVAARAPYFHDGSAATLSDVVAFYNTRFAMGLTPQQHADLVAFLRAL